MRAATWNWCAEVEVGALASKKCAAAGRHCAPEEAVCRSVYC